MLEAEENFQSRLLDKERQHMAGLHRDVDMKRQQNSEEEILAEAQYWVPYPG